MNNISKAIVCDREYLDSLQKPLPKEILFIVEESDGSVSVVNFTASYSEIPFVMSEDSPELLGKIFLLIDRQSTPLCLKYRDVSGKVYPLVDFTVQDFEVHTSDGYSVLSSSVLGQVKLLSLTLSGRLPSDIEESVVVNSKAKSSAISWKSILAGQADEVDVSQDNGAVVDFEAGDTVE